MYKTYEAYYVGNTMDIDMATWERDYFVLAYDLRCYQGPSNPNALPLLRSGELKLNMKFTKPLKESLHVLVYSWSPALLTLDSKGQASVSYRT